MAGQERPGHAGGPGEVVERGLRHVHAAVGVVDPVDRDLMDPEAVALGEEEQLGVEEPTVVADRRQELLRDVGAHGLEPALRVADPRREGRAQEEVVRTREELALRVSARPTSRASGAIRSRGRCGRRRVARRAAASAARSVERSTSMYASTFASLLLHAARSARPRPFASRCRARTDVRSLASRTEPNQVPSVEALSTIVICQRNGNVAERYAWSRRTLASSVSLLVVDRNDDVDDRGIPGNRCVEHARLVDVSHVRRVVAALQRRAGVA